MKISTILDSIDLGTIALPEFQRGYVWNREQVRGLMHSLYHKHPVGSLLVWATRTETADARGGGKLAAGSVKLLLDGQQRITSLYGIIRGNPPEFFDGNDQAFTGLHFHLDDEVFEFYASAKMKDNPLWINVTELMQADAGVFLQRLLKSEGQDETKITDYINRFSAICSIKEIDLHVEEVTGEDKTVDVVVDIFNRVNSGGTKLSKGDLALAKICASWPAARGEMKKRLDKWEKNGFNFKLEWLLRIINSLITGEALFTALEHVDVATFQRGLENAEKTVDSILNLISGRLGLDHNRVLGSRASFPLIARYMDRQGGDFGDYRKRDELLYWYIHTLLWGRYAGSTESTLAQDLRLVEKGDGALDRLIAQLRQDRGDLRLNANDFSGWSKGARFYPLLYMLTRVHKARDWESGIELSSHLLGRLNSLQVHHIFPKNRLYEHGYSRPEVNAIANFTFITQEANLKISDRDSAEYLDDIESRNPGVLASHWIPTDRQLWKIDNYPEFLAARRDLLAQAANDFLDSLLSGQRPEDLIAPKMTFPVVAGIPGGIESDEEAKLLMECNKWIAEQKLPEGELRYELTDDDGCILAILDLAWPEGLQVGLTQPVALLIDEGQETEIAVNNAGYRYFTDVNDFRRYVSSDVLGLDEPPTQRATRGASIRGRVIASWEAEGEPAWNVEKTMHACLQADEDISREGLNPAPRFRQAIHQSDHKYITGWVLGCRFPWL